MTFGGGGSKKCKWIYQNNLKVRPLRFDTTEMSYCFKFLFFCKFVFLLWGPWEVCHEKELTTFLKRKKKSIIVFFKAVLTILSCFFMSLMQFPNTSNWFLQLGDVLSTQWTPSSVLSTLNISFILVLTDAQWGRHDFPPSAEEVIETSGTGTWG